MLDHEADTVEQGAGDDADDEAVRGRLGTLMGGYRLSSVLGVGGTAAVYKGIREDGEAVAVKVLHGFLNADARAKKRFLHEAAIAARVRHPGIVRMLSEGEAPDGTAYLIMELAEGETVESRRLAQGGSLLTKEVFRLTEELLTVLSVAHAEGIVHRDIKPHNLFIAADGRLRLLDFGIARATELSDVKSMVTRTGAVIGTVFFMPPEQALGVRDDIDARSDVWAVGATMLTLLTGRFVHEARTINEALVLAATRPAPSIRSMLPTVGRPLAAVIDRALSFERKARYADAREMLAALREVTPHDAAAAAALGFAETLPETAASSLGGPSDPVAPPERRRDTKKIALIGVAAALSLLAVGGVAGVVRSWGTPEPPPAPVDASASAGALPPPATQVTLPPPTPSTDVSKEGQAAPLSPGTAASPANSGLRPSGAANASSAPASTPVAPPVMTSTTLPVATPARPVKPAAPARTATTDLAEDTDEFRKKR